MTDVLARQRVLWSGTVGFDRTVWDCVEVAAATGYPHVSVATQSLRATDDADLLDVARRAADVGVAVSVLDGFYPWLPIDEPKVAAVASSLDEILRQIDALGTVLVNALALPSAAQLPLEEKVERFGRLCDALADAGAQVILEFSPLGGVADLRAALDIVDGADRANGGILFDTWHFFRGTPDYDLLRSCCADRIKAVQISDADAEVRDSLWKDTINHRRVPGEGSFDLDAVLGVLDERGMLDWYGPEVISTELRALSPLEAVRRATDAMDAALVSALAPTRPTI